MINDQSQLGTKDLVRKGNEGSSHLKNGSLLNAIATEERSAQKEVGRSATEISRGKCWRGRGSVREGKELAAACRRR